jgi:hypothetical protein
MTKERQIGVGLHLDDVAEGPRSATLPSVALLVGRGSGPVNARESPFSPS